MNKIGLACWVFMCLSFLFLEAEAQRDPPGWRTSDTLQSQKQLEAVKVKGHIELDGRLNEPVWAGVPATREFVTYSPSIGEPSRYDTRVKVVYNDRAMYFGAFMKDDPDKIVRGLSKRDEEDVNADKFWVTLNPYNDGKNIFKFVVTTANVRSDIKISPRNEDRAWDAVWDSKVSVVDSGWVVEMEIPYDAIRFPKKERQTWGINFWRLVRRERTTLSWNLVDRTRDSEGSQYGELVNVHDIDPPFRLSLFPYISGYVFPHSGRLDYEYSAGMDLKYGIDESFTLDMILIPDFGQKRSDETVLNLSPYEVRYDEKRPFFTEGTELFNKAGLFYSRRVGGEPAGYGRVDDQLREGEHIVENPDESELINATKISGRNRQGLGLGFFNAMEANTYATVKDSLGNKRKIRTQPFTNYNMMVVDENFGPHSYLNLINTNFYQPKTGRMQNVTGSAYKISDRSNAYALWGNMAWSMHQDSSSAGLTQGQYIDASLGKVSGNFRFGYNINLLTDTYDHNALGYLRRNNELTHALNLEYGVYEPQGPFLHWNARLGIDYNSLYQPREFTDFNIQAHTRMMLKGYLFLMSNIQYRPTGMSDYFEPRVPGRVFNRPRYFEADAWFSSDYRKPLAVDIRLGYRSEFGTGYFYSIGPRLRIGDKFLFVYTFEYDQFSNQKGFVDITDGGDRIIFGRRDNLTYTNSIEGSYIFSNKSWLSLNVRHYWSQVDYDKYYSLQPNGDLTSDPGYTRNADLNYNVFNVDLMYSWNFAPGSFLKLVWKNSIQEREHIQANQFYGFFDNLENTFGSRQAQNSFSVKVTYYLDYKYLFRAPTSQ